MKKLIFGLISILIIATTMASMAFAEGYSDKETVQQVQEVLNENGYDCGTSDGVAGAKTNAAIEQYKTDNGLGETSPDITDELLLSLGISTEEPVEITEGFYRKVADNLDPEIVVSATSKALYIERDYGEDGLDNIGNFYGIVCQFIKNVAVWKDYSSIMASFFAENSLEVISVSKIEGINEFTTFYPGSFSSDANIKFAFPIFYSSVFGAHDTSVQLQKGMSDIYDQYTGSQSEIPKEYRNGRFWVFSCFDADNCKIVTMDDSSIELQISVENTKYSGWESKEEMTAALEMFNYLNRNDAASMPYNKLIIKYVDQEDANRVFYEFEADRSAGKWTTIINELRVQPFADGAMASQNGERVQKEEVPEETEPMSEEENETRLEEPESVPVQTEEANHEAIVESETDINSSVLDESEAETEGTLVEETEIVSEKPVETEMPDTETEEALITESETEETETEELKDFTISFRGIPWYSKRSEAEAVILGDGENVVGSLGNPNEMDNLRGAFVWDYTMEDQEYKVDGAGCRGWYNHMDVAGYTPTFVWAYYLYPVQDGVLVKDDDEAEFYFAYYEFMAGDFSDYNAIYEDLAQKLETLYGKPEEKTSDFFKASIWSDNEDNKIVLSSLTQNDNVKLAYIAGEANDRLEEALSILDAEALSEENAEREENKNNTNGL